MACATSARRLALEGSWGPNSRTRSSLSLAARERPSVCSSAALAPGPPAGADAAHTNRCPRRRRTRWRPTRSRWQSLAVHEVGQQQERGGDSHQAAVRPTTDPRGGGQDRDEHHERTDGRQGMDGGVGPVDDQTTTSTSDDRYCQHDPAIALEAAPGREEDSAQRPFVLGSCGSGASLLGYQAGKNRASSGRRPSWRLAAAELRVSISGLWAARRAGSRRVWPPQRQIRPHRLAA